VFSEIFRISIERLAPIILVVCVTTCAYGHAAGRSGDLIQSDILGMNLTTLNLETGATKGIASTGGLSQMIGLHYYVADGVRVGMNFLFTEQVWGAHPPSGSGFSTFGILPQVGWDFWGPMFGAVALSFLPRTSGTALLDLGVQGIVGAGLPLSKVVGLTGAVQVPFNFKIARTIGITPLLGVSIKLK